MFPVSHVHKHDLLGARDYTTVMSDVAMTRSSLLCTARLKPLAKIDIEIRAGDFFMLIHWHRVSSRHHNSR